MEIICLWILRAKKSKYWFHTLKNLLEKEKDKMTCLRVQPLILL